MNSTRRSFLAFPDQSRWMRGTSLRPLNAAPENRLDERRQKYHELLLPPAAYGEHVRQVVSNPRRVSIMKRLGMCPQNQYLRPSSHHHESEKARHLPGKGALLSLQNPSHCCQRQGYRQPQRCLSSTVRHWQTLLMLPSTSRRHLLEIKMPIYRSSLWIQYWRGRWT